MTVRTALGLAAALVAGAMIASVDSRPAWDDTGITAAMLLGASGIVGFVWPRRPWLWALAVGLWIPLLAVARHQSPWMFLVLGFTFAGAYGGTAIRKALSADKRL